MRRGQLNPRHKRLYFIRSSIQALYGGVYSNPHRRCVFCARRFLQVPVPATFDWSVRTPGLAYRKKEGFIFVRRTLFGAFIVVHLAAVKPRGTIVADRRKTLLGLAEKPRCEHGSIVFYSHRCARCASDQSPPGKHGILLLVGELSLYDRPLDSGSRLSRKARFGRAGPSVAAVHGVSPLHCPR